MKRKLVETKLFDILNEIGLDKKKCAFSFNGELIDVWILIEDIKKGRIRINQRLMTAISSINTHSLKSGNYIRIAFEPEKIREFHKKWLEKRK